MSSQLWLGQSHIPPNKAAEARADLWAASHDQWKEQREKEGEREKLLDFPITQEMALTQLFTGYVDTVKYTCNIKLTPAVQNNTEKNILFRFSRKLGILEKDNLAGKPIYYDFTSKNVIIPATDGKKIVKKEGICYNVPGRAQVRIYTPSETFFDKEVPIAQLGNVEILSKSLFNKNADTQVVFDTATGGIIRIDKE